MDQACKKPILTTRNAGDIVVSSGSGLEMSSVAVKMARSGDI